jgi:hypothetical protein
VYKKPGAPLSIGGVLDDAIKLYRASFRSCWVISLIGAALLGGAGIYFAALMGRVALAGPQAAASLTTLAAAFGGGGVLMTEVVLYLVSYLVYTALMAQMNSVALGHENPSALSSFLLALRRLPGAIVAAIVFSVAVGIGFVLFLIPGIYLWGKLQFWLVAVVADDVGGIEALGRSWEVTKNNWWRSATSLTVALIIILVLSALDFLVTGGVAGGLATTIHVNLADVLIVSQIVRAVVSVFILPMLPAALLAIYYDMKMRREGGDLLARAKSLQPA